MEWILGDCWGRMLNGLDGIDDDLMVMAMMITMTMMFDDEDENSRERGMGVSLSTREIDALMFE